MNTVSLCMIVKDEEDVIERCLESVYEATDEIIIVDTGSTDRTKEICLKYTNKIFDFEWIDDFAAARNYAFSLATMDYIFWLDADDVLKEEDQVKLQTLKDTLDPSVDSVTMHYNLAFDENGNVTSSLRRNRLVKREKNYQWYGAVHEYLEVAGIIINSDIAVTHSSMHHNYDRNLRIYENRLTQGEEFSPRDLFYFANELSDHQKYERAIEVYQQFLATKKGWVEDNISACGKLADCFHNLGDEESERYYILKSFEYDTPRADFCCRMGYQLLHKNQPDKALVWYRLATQLDKPTQNMGIINHACWTWLPHLQLCVCYSQLGNNEFAYMHNEIARQYHPNHPSIKHNKSYLEPIVQKNQLAKQANAWLTMAAKVDQKFLPETGTEKLRITYVMNHMKVCGGVKIVLDYTNYLVKRGHQVHIVCYDPEPTWIKVQANYIQVPAEMGLVEAIPDTDVIITTVWDQMLNCYLAQKAPVIHVEHGDIYIFEFENFDQDSKEIWRQRWSVPVPILAVSSGLAAQLNKNFQRKPQVLHNALNDKVFFPRNNNQPIPERPRILFVGPEQWSYKGIPDILHAIEMVRQSGRDIEPVWVTQTEPVSNFKGTLHISPPQDKLGELYRTCDLYVCGSYYESFPLPPLEAMTSGCAVVSTRNIGVLEYAEEGENCLLVDIGDAKGLAAAIIELLDDEEKKSRLVRRGYETAQKFKWVNIMERFEMSMYGQVRAWRERL